MEEIRREKYLTDIALDYYNKRMAICNTTRRIHIFSKKIKNNIKEWVEVASWDSQDVVFKLQWSHPIYGNLLVSCGLDKLVMIWKEDKDQNGSNWKLLAKIQDFSDSVEDISICPRIYGLKLAAVTSNGILKIFEPTTDYRDYSKWDCLTTKDINSSGCTSVCWNPSLRDPQTLVVGSKKDCNKLNDGKAQLIQIFWYNESKKEYMLASNLEGHSDTVTDVEWVKTHGRDYHLIASTSLDKKVIIWKVDLLLVKNNQHVNEIKIKYQQILNYKHEQTLWRLSWNNNGMMLSVKGEDRKPLIFWNVKGRYTKMDLIGE